MSCSRESIRNGFEQEMVAALLDRVVSRMVAAHEDHAIARRRRMAGEGQAILSPATSIDDDDVDVRIGGQRLPHRRRHQRRG